MVPEAARPENMMKVDCSMQRRIRLSWSVIFQKHTEGEKDNLKLSEIVWQDVSKWMFPFIKTPSFKKNLRHLEAMLMEANTERNLKWWHEKDILNVVILQL